MTKRVLALLVALALLPSVAGAGESRDHDRVRRAVLSGEILPLSAILDRVNAEYAGELIEAELEDKYGQPVYEIKLVTKDGKLLKLHYDARDGRKLSVREKSR
jgi:uncharacterized membrane protein YkoI